MAGNAPKKTLGRGLDALLEGAGPIDSLPDIEVTRGEEVKLVPIDLIDRNKEQPRKDFSSEEIKELAESISQKGILQPILVRPSKKEKGRYEIVAGERRWRASQEAKLSELPVIIKNYDDVEVLEIALIENIQRQNLNALEEGLAYSTLKETYGYTDNELSSNLGKSRSHISNMMRLLKLPEAVQKFVREGKLSAGHARALINADDPQALAEKAIADEMSVRAIEAAVKSGSSSETVDEKLSASAKSVKDADTQELEGNLSASLRMKVDIKHKGANGGSIVITYKTIDDLDEVCERLLKAQEAVLAS